MKSGLREISLLRESQDVECEIYMDLAFSVCSSRIPSNDKFFFYKQLPLYRFWYRNEDEWSRAIIRNRGGMHFRWDSNTDDQSERKEKRNM